MHEAREHLELQYTLQEQWLVEGVQEKKGPGKLSLALSFMPRWSLMYLFFPLFFENLIHYVTKQGIPVPSFPDFTDNFNEAP
jgi:hypothetical protein